MFFALSDFRNSFRNGSPPASMDSGSSMITTFLTVESNEAGYMTQCRYLNRSCFVSASEEFRSIIRICNSLQISLIAVVFPTPGGP